MVMHTPTLWTAYSIMGRNLQKETQIQHKDAYHKKPSDYHIFKSGIDLVEEVNLPASRLQWLNHE